MKLHPLYLFSLLIFPIFQHFKFHIHFSMYFPSLLSIIRWVYLDKRPFTTQLTCYVIITLFASMILFKTNLYFDSKKKSDITSFIIRSHGQDFVSSRLIAKSIRALLASSYQTNKGFKFPRPNQAGCLGNLIHCMLKLSRVTSCCYSHR